jgi:ketosteroid isomerase-like protein
MKIARVAPAAMALVLGACAAIGPASHDELAQQVTKTERAFAKTMADRDHARFTTFLSDEAVFISGSTVSHGKRQVSERWAALFDKPAAPFSWERG